MTPRTRVVASVSSVLGLIGMVVSGWVFLDDRYAHAEDVQKLEENTVKTLETYRKTQIVNQLNQIAVKEKLDESSQYDELLKQQLELELQLLSEGSK